MDSHRNLDTDSDSDVDSTDEKGDKKTEEISKFQQKHCYNLKQRQENTKRFVENLVYDWHKECNDFHSVCQLIPIGKFKRRENFQVTMKSASFEEFVQHIKNSITDKSVNDVIGLCLDKVTRLMSGQNEFIFHRVIRDFTSNTAGIVVYLFHFAKFNEKWLSNRIRQALRGVPCHDYAAYFIRFTLYY